MKSIRSAFQVNSGRWARVSLTAILLAAVFFGQGSRLPAQAGTQIDLIGPAGSGCFGQWAPSIVLPNGNIVVIDTCYNAPGPIANVGAVYLYDGATGALISTLTGSKAGDGVGRVTVLKNGNFVVSSPGWDNGTTVDVGAVTWGNATTGVSGVVTTTNSLVGSQTGDMVGSDGVLALNNGNYLVGSTVYDNGPAADAGALTWGNGATGLVGVVSPDNSLVGSTANDWIGLYGLTQLANDNYVATSPYWDNGSAADAGAVTWGSGTAGVSGVISAANSLVGSTKSDSIGLYRVRQLTNGNYLVVSPGWDNGPAVDAGAVTWGDGTTGVSGVMTTTNSLVGFKAGDQIGSAQVAPLSNGSYVVLSPYWDNGPITDVGAATWGDGAMGVSGIVTATNSLVGFKTGDQQFAEVKALTNGNYIVISSRWDNGSAVDAGAVTWGSGTAGVRGVITTTNSLVGSTPGDTIGSPGVRELNNGNYVVASVSWDNGPLVEAGAATWGDGKTGVHGPVSAANSLVGSNAWDMVGYSNSGLMNGITALTNGNYVVLSSNATTWGNGTTGVSGVITTTNSLVGASYNVTALTNGNYVVTGGVGVTWGNGAVGTVGERSAANSLVGLRPNGVTPLSNGNYVVSTIDGTATWGDGNKVVSGTVTADNSLIGGMSNTYVTALKNGNYVVTNYAWNNGPISFVGAVTWGDGSKGVSGVVSAANSLVGSTSGDVVGCSKNQCPKPGVTALDDGSFVVQSTWYQTAQGGGAVTFGGGACTGPAAVGPLTASNSVIGNVKQWEPNFVYDLIHHQLVVDRTTKNTVTLLKFDCAYKVFAPMISR